jgi:glucokinase
MNVGNRKTFAKRGYVALTPRQVLINDFKAQEMAINCMP